MTDIKLIVLDIDGTLLNNAHELTPRTETALKAAMEKGVQVVLATGKTIASSRDLVKRLNITTPGIYSQGTSIHEADGSLRHQQTLSADVVRQLITFAEDRGFTVAIYSGTRVIMRRLTGIEKTLTDHHEPEPEVAGALQNILDETPVNKLIVFNRGEGQTLPSLRWQINAQINGAVSMVIVAGHLEILPAGSSKGAGVKSVLKDLKVPAEQVMAVGDGDNDIEMLQLVGIGVAVENATPKLKEVAKYVVASNDADGVAEAIERFVLNIETKSVPITVATTAETHSAKTEKPAETPAQNEGAP
jgi:Cof subfamily protein (haloacid dehalogenase superfamily)